MLCPQHPDAVVCDCGVPYERIARALQLEALGEKDKTHYVEALHIVKSHTFNVPWYESLLRKIQGNAPIDSRSPDQWKHQAQTWYNERLNDCRAQQFRATQGHDLSEMAALSLQLGNIFVLGGGYRQAQMNYRQARSLDSQFDAEGIYRSTQVDIIQGNFSLVTTSVGKVGGDFATDSDLWFNIGINFALSSWALNDAPNCLATLLHLSYGSGDIKRKSAWVSRENIGAMIAICALQTFSRENLLFLARADPIFTALADEFPYLGQLIHAFVDLRIEDLWSHWRAIVVRNSMWAVAMVLPAAQQDIRKLIWAQYMLVHRSGNLSTLTGLFSLPDGRFNYTELASLAERLKLSVEVDTIANTVHFSPVGLNLDPTLAQAKEYVRSLMMTQWAFNRVQFLDLTAENGTE